MVEPPCEAAAWMMTVRVEVDVQAVGVGGEGAFPRHGFWKGRRRDVAWLSHALASVGAVAPAGERER